MKRVLCIADCCCDLIFGGLPKLPEPGEEIYGSHFSMQAGGGANTAVLLARSGVPTAFWSQIGDDLAGQIVKETLEQSGVRMVLHQGTARRTPVSAVLSTFDNRAFASFAEPGDLIADVRELENAIRNADLVHTFLGYCASYPIAALCEQYGVLLSVDTSFCDANPAYLDTILPHCDYWKGNETEALRLTGAECVEDALTQLAGRVRKGAVITCGARGSIGAERGGMPIEQPVVPFGAFLDACGAGDAFAAGMLAGLSRNEPFSACMQRGATLSGRVVTAYGGCPQTLPIPCE